MLLYLKIGHTAVHFHVLVLDGVYAEDAYGKTRVPR